MEEKTALSVANPEKLEQGGAGLAPNRGFLTRQKSNVNGKSPQQNNPVGFTNTWTLQSNAREKQILKDVYHKVQHHYNMQRKLGQTQANKDLLSYKEMGHSLKKDMDRRIVEDESVLAIINKTERRQKLIHKMRKAVEVSDDDPTTLVSQHREEFAHFLWKRKVDRKRQVRSLIQDGPKLICKIGDMISDSNLEILKSFEQHMKAMICKSSIMNGYFGVDDLPAYFLPRILLLKPFRPAPNIMIDEKRVSFRVQKTLIMNHKKVIPDWGCVLGSDGPSYSKLLNKPSIKDLLLMTQKRLESQIQYESSGSLNNLVSAINGGGSAEDKRLRDSCKQILANLLDACFPTHKLSALTLAFPLQSPEIINFRLTELGFKALSGTKNQKTPSKAGDDYAEEDFAAFDPKVALDYIETFLRRVDRELKFYFEFSASQGTNWRVGFAIESLMSYDCSDEYPGQHPWSFGFGSNGKVYHNGKEVEYVRDLSNATTGKTFGILLDLYYGSICLMIDGKPLPVAFGYGSEIFSEEEAMDQKALLQTSQLIPMLSIQVHPDKLEDPSFQASMQVNFGSGSLNFRPNCMTCDQSLAASYLGNIGDSTAGQSFDFKFGSTDGISEKEEERQIYERNNFHAAFQFEGMRTFSHFPPSVYRKGLAASKIQRAWRRYLGRKFRKQLTAKLNEAAFVIQKFSKRLLLDIQKKKNRAATAIQRFWRIKMFITVKLLSIRYRCTISELHRNATKIQKKFREWAMYRNSPIAAKYGIRLDLLTRYVVKLQNWWRPLIIKRREVIRKKALDVAATKIQRLWRGYRLRSMLRKDYREQLGSLGRNVLRHRRELMIVRATYVIQRAFRHFKRKLVRKNKLATRNKAASKIQAIWKGFWVRTHIHLKFSYGEAVFLAAVCKQLRMCHFLLKMYRPCGVVCPK